MLGYLGLVSAFAFVFLTGLLGIVGVQTLWMSRGERLSSPALGDRERVRQASARPALPGCGGGDRAGSSRWRASVGAFWRPPTPRQPRRGRQEVPGSVFDAVRRGCQPLRSPVEIRRARPAVNHSRPRQRLAESSRLRRAGDAPKGGGSARGTRSHAGEPRLRAQAQGRPQVAHGRGVASIPGTAPSNPLRQPLRTPSCLPPRQVAPRSQRFCELLSVRETVRIGIDPNPGANYGIGLGGAAKADASSQNRSDRMPKANAVRTRSRIPAPKHAA